MYLALLHKGRLPCPAAAQKVNAEYALLLTIACGRVTSISLQGLKSGIDVPSLRISKLQVNMRSGHEVMHGVKLYSLPLYLQGTFEFTSGRTSIIWRCALVF